MGGGSFGAQLGVESTDVVMLVMNQRGMDRLAADKFTIGANASAAIGPVGRSVGVGTDATLRAEILTYARSKGAFAGAALDGTTITQDSSENHKLYGRDIRNREIIRGSIPAPEAADSRSPI
jgi:lipid-binding SYLF domain-containing protein